MAVFVEPDVGLSDNVLVFFPRRQVERPGLMIRAASFGAELLVSLLELFQWNVLAGLELRVAAIDDAHVFNHATIARPCDTALR